jgi:hypothetical protein
MVVLNLVKSFRNSTGFTVCPTAAGPKWAGLLGRRQSSYTIGSSVPLLFMSMLLPETFSIDGLLNHPYVIIMLNITLIFIGTIESPVTLHRLRPCANYEDIKLSLVPRIIPSTGPPCSVSSTLCLPMLPPSPSSWLPHLRPISRGLHQPLTASLCAIIGQRCTPCNLSGRGYSRGRRPRSPTPPLDPTERPPPNFGAHAILVPPREHRLRLRKQQQQRRIWKPFLSMQTGT